MFLELILNGQHQILGMNRIIKKIARHEIYENDSKLLLTDGRKFKCGVNSDFFLYFVFFSEFFFFLEFIAFDRRATHDIKLNENKNVIENKQALPESN